MQLKEKFKEAFDTELADSIFKEVRIPDSGKAPTLVGELAVATVQEVSRYVLHRHDDSGTPLPIWAIEQQLCSEILNDDAPQTILVRGRMGSGKSSLVEFVLRFYYYFEDHLLSQNADVNSFDRLLAELASSESRVSFRDSSDSRPLLLPLFLRLPAQTVNLSAKEIVSQMLTTLVTDLLAAFPNIHKEANFAMLRRGKDSPLANSLYQRFLDEAETLVLDSGRFVPLALRYLHFDRKPRTESRKVVCVLDDIDPLPPGVGYEVYSQLINTLSGAGVGVKLVVPIRPETLRRQGNWGGAVLPSVEINAGAVDIRKVLEKRSDRLSVAVESSPDDLPNVKVGANGSEYLLPLPVPRVVQMARAVGCVARGTHIDGEYADDASDTYGGYESLLRCEDAFARQIAPIIGMDSRRAAYFHRRISSSTVLDFRLRHQYGVTRHHLLLALLTGESGRVDALQDRDSVGVLWCAAGGSFLELFRQYALLTVLAEGTTPQDVFAVLGSGESAKSDASQFVSFSIETMFADMVSLGFDERAVKKAMAPWFQRGYVERFDEGCDSVHFNRGTILGLRDLMFQPVYIELSSLFWSNKGSVVLSDGSVKTVEQCRLTFRAVLEFLGMMRNWEASWVFHISNRRPLVKNAISSVKIVSPTSWAIAEYTERLEGLWSHFIKVGSPASALVTSTLEALAELQQGLSSTVSFFSLHKR